MFGGSRDGLIISYVRAHSGKCVLLVPGLSEVFVGTIVERKSGLCEDLGCNINLAFVLSIIACCLSTLNSSACSLVLHVLGNARSTPEAPSSKWLECLCEL